MKTRKIGNAIMAIVYFISLAGIFAGCTAQEDRTLGTNHWNWIVIGVSLGIGFLIGILVSNWRTK